jgi:hypothetical protein
MAPWPLTVGHDMHYPLTILHAQMLEEDARRAGERRARLLDATAEKREIARVNPRRPERKPRLLRRIFRPSAEPAPVRLD